MNKIKLIYDELLELYGHQGWWPLVGYAGCNPTKTGCVNGYHPGDYSFPRNEKEKFEIVVGAVLTQNTGWISVEKALSNLNKANALTPKGMQKLSDAKLKELIKPAGYYNQKAKYLRNITSLFLNLAGKTPTRDDVLDVKGIGNETCDSILLYAYKQPEFVVDAYTKRIFVNLGLIKNDAGYMEIKHFFESDLKKDYILFQEYHALIVEHAKRYYSKKPYGIDDPLCEIR